MRRLILLGALLLTTALASAKAPNVVVLLSEGRRYREDGEREESEGDAEMHEGLFWF
jgi:hypothetical protein